MLQRGVRGVDVAAAGLVAALTLLRTFTRHELRPGRARDLAGLLSELLVQLGVVVATGGWDSAFVFSLSGTAVVVGYGIGIGAAACAGVVLPAAITAVYHLRVPLASTRSSVLGSCQLLLLFLLAGYARRVFTLQAGRASAAFTRIERLTEANDLLFELYRVAQTLPVSLDLGDTLAATTLRIRELYQPDVLAVLLAEDGRWVPHVAEGTRIRAPLATSDLPAPMQLAIESPDAVQVAVLPSEGGLSFLSRSGVYMALRARGAVIGLLAVEQRAEGSLRQRDARLLEGVAEQTALAIDNARLFSRLRSVGADEERTRIARDLHDRVGQSLAYLGFELDRVLSRVGDHEVRADLVALRTDVGRAVTEIRETLYDLRTDVSDTQDVGAALQDFLDRVAGRSDLHVRFRVDADRRLPIPLERELLRIAQEAVVNVERHARAEAVSVTWQVDAAGAEVVVADDGIGFSPGAGRTDSFGIKGMRERADAIGAVLLIDSSPGRGTVVRCSVPHAAPPPTRDPLPEAAAPTSTATPLEAP